MPLLDDDSIENKLKEDEIDYDFYDSVLDTDSNFEEEITSGVEKILINPIQENTSSNSTIKTESENKGIFINDSDCDLNDSLTKCIAYETTQYDSENFESDACGFSDGEVSPILGSSLSASTPSDFTTVTPLTSSSSYSSLNKENLDDDCSVTKESPKEEMKLLNDAVETLTLQKKQRRSAIPVSVNSKQIAGKSRRKNMTFSNDELRKIDRENEILLKKIMSYSKPSPKPSAVLNNTTPVRTVKASAAVNRNKKQREINRDNYILLKKIHNAKPSQSYFNSRSSL